MKRFYLSAIVLILALGCNSDTTAPGGSLPTGRLIARQGLRIIAFDLDGSNMDTIVTAVTGASIGSPRWIPGTNTIVYTQTLTYGCTDPAVSAQVMLLIDMIKPNLTL
jgi:hypothetical protein